jgi:CBS domain-containing protein
MATQPNTEDRLDSLTNQFKQMSHQLQQQQQPASSSYLQDPQFVEMLRKVFQEEMNKKDKSFKQPTERFADIESHPEYDQGDLQYQKQQQQQQQQQKYPHGPTGTELFDHLGQAPTAQIAAQLGQPGAYSQQQGQGGQGGQQQGGQGGGGGGFRGGRGNRGGNQSLQTRFQQIRPNRPRPMELELRKKLIQQKPKTLRDVFLCEPIEDIAFRNWQQRRTILISVEKFLERCLTRINRHGVHLLPVVSPVAGGIIGTIDVLDIIRSLIDCCDNTNQQQQLTIQQKVRRDFMNRPVSTQVTKNTYLISTRSTLWDAVKGFVEKEQDRFLIADREVNGVVEKFGASQDVEKDIDGVLTLADCLKFLVANSMYMREDPRFSRTLKELGLGKRIPKQINHLEVVSNAFRQMDREHHDGLAVVDDNGILIGNLSASDLKGITRQNCPILNTKIEDFITRDNRREWFYRPLILDINDTLYQTIHQFVSLGKQRFYFVDIDGKPVGEVNRRDIICEVWKIIQGDKQEFTQAQQHYSGQQPMQARGQQQGGQQQGGQQQGGMQQQQQGVSQQGMGNQQYSGGMSGMTGQGISQQGNGGYNQQYQQHQQQQQPQQQGVFSSAQQGGQQSQRGQQQGNY